jgi:hypothetical protein
MHAIHNGRLDRDITAQTAWRLVSFIVHQRSSMLRRTPNVVRTPRFILR